MKLFKISLALQMAIATLLGILCGFFFGNLCEVFAPYASAYIMILKITAIPYLIGAIIYGIGQLNASQAKQLLKKGLLLIALAWAINLLVIYGIDYLFPLPSTPQSGGYLSSETPQLNFAELLIPDNIFYDLANNIVPAIVMFSLLIGIALIAIRNKNTLMDTINDLVTALTRVTAWIARITPWGTFLIIANQVGTIQLSTIKQVSTYVILFVIGTCVLVFWIFPKLISMLTSIPSYRWLQQLLPILVLAYTTNMVIVCLPYIIELLKKETAQINPQDDQAQQQIQGTVSTIFNIPLGSLFIMTFVFFVAARYSTPLPFSSQANLFITVCLNGLGAAGLGAWINTLSFILDSLNLPLEAVNLYLTALPFTTGFQSLVSVMEVASVSLLITLSCRNMLTLRLSKILQKGLITLAPIALLVTGLKLFNPLPEVRNETKSIYELSISSSIPVHISPVGTAGHTVEDTLDRILRTKTLRVGYDPQVAPFCFFNADRQIVGYDIAFAYELAYDLGCQLELVPLHYKNLSQELNDQFYDIAMAAISVNETRLKELTFSDPYLRARFCFIVDEQMRQQFSSINAIYQEKEVKIAVLKGSSFEAIAKELFPQTPLILLDNYEAFASLQDPYVALLWEEQEAVTWTLNHRQHRVVFPHPALGFDTLGYALSNGNPRFLNYLNQWLALKKTQGFSDKQYDLWIKGKTEIAAPPEPRWSVIRNVLHWID